MRQNREKYKAKVEDDAVVNHCLLRLCGPQGELLPWDKPPALLTLSRADLELILSFVLAPTVISVVCAVNRQLCQRAWSPDAWISTIVNSTTIHPAGRLAFNHFRLWGRSRVVGGRWQWRCVSLLLSHKFCLWRWASIGDPFLAVGGKYLLVSSRSVWAPVLMQIHLKNLRGPVHMASATQRNLGAVVAWSKGRARKGISGACLLSSGQCIPCAEGFVAVSPFGNNAWDVPALSSGFVVMVFGYRPEGRVIPCWTLT